MYYIKNNLYKEDDLTLQYLVSTKSSYILQKTCNFQLQFRLSMHDLLVDTIILYFVI